MADKGKKANDNKKKTAASSKSKVEPSNKKSTGAVAKGKTAVSPKKTERTTAKAKTSESAKKPKKQEPKPPAKVMKELEQLAKKHGAGANAPAKPTPKVNVNKSGETRVAPPRNAKVKEVTVKYKFE